MTAPSRSAKRFSERAGLRPTHVTPHPVFGEGANPAHRLELDPPLPNPELLAGTQGNPPPDRAATEEWPHGAASED